MAVRRDHEAGNIIATELRTEFDLYDRLKDVDIPVARALWFEDDPSWMPHGRPAYVRELVDGDWYLPSLVDTSPQNDGVRIALSKEHIDKLELVHAADWRGFGLDAVLPVPSVAHWTSSIAASPN